MTVEKPARSIAEIKASLVSQGLTDTKFIEGWCRFKEDILLVGDPLSALGELRTSATGARELHAGENGEVLMGNLNDGELQGRLAKEFRGRFILATTLGVPSLGVLGWLFQPEQFFAIREWFMYRFFY